MVLKGNFEYFSSFCKELCRKMKVELFFVKKFLKNFSRNVAKVKEFYEENQFSQRLLNTLHKKFFNLSYSKAAEIVLYFILPSSFPSNFYNRKFTKILRSDNFPSTSKAHLKTKGKWRKKLADFFI